MALLTELIKGTETPLQPFRLFPSFPFRGSGKRWVNRFASAAKQTTKKIHQSKLMKTKQNLNYVKFALIVSIVALPLMTQAGPHPRYKLIDLGTFGGPSSTFEDLSKTINNHGTVIGG